MSSISNSGMSPFGMPERSKEETEAKRADSPSVREMPGKKSGSKKSREVTDTLGQDKLGKAQTQDKPKGLSNKKIEKEASVEAPGSFSKEDSLVALTRRRQKQKKSGPEVSRLDKGKKFAREEKKPLNLSSSSKKVMDEEIEGKPEEVKRELSGSLLHFSEEMNKSEEENYGGERVSASLAYPDLGQLDLEEEEEDKFKEPKGTKEKRQLESIFQPEVSESEEEIKEEKSTKESSVPSAFLFGRRAEDRSAVVEKAQRYCLLLNEADRPKESAPLIKKSKEGLESQEISSGFFSRFADNLKNVASFKEMLKVAKGAFEEDPIMGLTLLLSMRNNQWAKEVMSFDPLLKGKLQSLYSKMIQQVIRDSSQAFALTLSKITDQELRNQSKYTGDTEKMREHCPNLFQLEQISNDIQFSIVHDVLSQEDVRQRRAIIEAFIKVGQMAFKKGDFATASNVLSGGLDSIPIGKQRLKLTWQGLSEKSRDLFDELLEKVGDLRATEPNRKRMESYAIPSLVPFITRLPYVLEQVKGFQNGIEAVEKQVKLLEECVESKKAGQLRAKLQEWEEKLEIIEAQVKKERQEKKETIDMTQLEKLREMINLARSVDQAKDVSEINFSEQREQIKNYQAGIEKSENEYKELILRVLKLSKKASSRVDKQSPVEKSSWFNKVKVDLGKREEINEEAYNHSLTIEPKVKPPVEGE